MLAQDISSSRFTSFDGELYPHILTFSDISVADAFANAAAAATAAFSQLEEITIDLRWPCLERLRSRRVSLLYEA